MALSRLPDPAVWKPFLIVNITFCIQVRRVLRVLAQLLCLEPVWLHPSARLHPAGAAVHWIHSPAHRHCPGTALLLSLSVLTTMLQVSRVILALGHLASSLLMTRCGRRTVFITSCVGSALSLVGFGLSYSLHPASSTSIFGSSDLNTNITGE